MNANDSQRESQSSSTRRVRVLIVEDSLAVRTLLEHIVARDPRLEVAASVATAEEALRLLPRVRPDVVSMDIRLPGMNGFEATQHIMADCPTPIVVVSASVEAEDLRISMNALRAGALAVVEKPLGTSHADYALMAQRLCTQLVIMSEVKVVRQRRGRSFDVASAESAVPERRARQPIALHAPVRMVGLVASTGGPNALAKLLGQLPADFPVPVLLVQHITASFHAGFVHWLRDVSRLPVELATDDRVPQPATVYVAPADAHLCVAGFRLRIQRTAPVCSQRPSGTVLLRSMADSLGRQAVGVLLTGMGEDGADGLRQLRAAGGYTIAEDASTAVVFGMPAAAVRLDAVCDLLPLEKIGPRLIELTALEVRP